MSPSEFRIHCLWFKFGKFFLFVVVFENWLKLFYFPSSFKNLKYKQFTSNSMTSFPVCNPSRSARPPFMQRLCKFSHILRWFLSLQTRLVTAIKCRRSQANTAHTRQQAFKALTCEITCRRHSLPPLVWERNMYAVQCAGRGQAPTLFKMNAWKRISSRRTLGIMVSNILKVDNHPL